MHASSNKTRNLMSVNETTYRRLIINSIGNRDLEKEGLKANAISYLSRHSN